MTPRAAGRSLSTRALLCFGAFALVGSAGRAAPPPGERLGSHITFHGWSPDGRFVAYTRARRRPSKMPGRELFSDEQQLHRVIEDARLAGFGPGFGRDLAAYALEHGYRDNTLEPRPVGTRTWDYSAPEGTYRLELEVGRRLFWKLSFDGRLITRQPCERLYVGLTATLHPSPDRRALVLIMHLDTGWITDSAVLVVRLPNDVRERWRAVGHSASR